MDEHLGYQKYGRSDSDNARNGTKSKKIVSSYGTMDIDVPQDRNSSFESKIVQKRKQDISDIESTAVRLLMLLNFTSLPFSIINSFSVDDFPFRDEINIDWFFESKLCDRFRLMIF